MSIANKAMVVSLQIGMWSGHRLDKEKSAEVTREANAVAGAARVNKHLIPKEALAPIAQAAGAVRNHFYSKTLPWKDNGDRLLTRAMYQQFIQEHAELRDAFMSSVRHFANHVYPSVLEQAEFRMGEMFNPNDYPHVSDIERRFYSTLDIDAITEKGDFRVSGLDADDVDQIKNDMEAAMQERITKAMGDVWRRVAETLGHFHERMQGDTIFRDSTVSNLKEIADLLPGLNLTNDPELTKIGAEIHRMVGGTDAKDIRKYPEMRQAISGQAKDIIDQMKGFMNAFATAS